MLHIPKGLVAIGQGRCEVAENGAQEAAVAVGPRKTRRYVDGHVVIGMSALIVGPFRK